MAGSRAGTGHPSSSSDSRLTGVKAQQGSQDLLHTVNHNLTNTGRQPGLTDQELRTGLLRPLCSGAPEILAGSQHLSVWGMETRRAAQSIRQTCVSSPVSPSCLNWML